MQSVVLVELYYTTVNVVNKFKKKLEKVDEGLYFVFMFSSEATIV